MTQYTRRPVAGYHLVPEGRPDLERALLLLAEQGKCVGARDPDLWWKGLPKGVTDSVSIARKRAAALCDGCSVIELCRWYALEAGEDDGVWGGLCEADRSTLRHGSSWRSRLHARSLYGADLPHGKSGDGGDAA